MGLTASYVEFADAVYAKMLNNQEALGLNSVFYGDQDRLPGTPVVCVEPSNKSNTLNGAPRRVEVNITVYLLIYHAEVGSPQDNRRNSDLLAEQIETLLHADRTLGGLVIHCMVSSIESGYVRKSRSVMRSSRVTFTAKSQTQLPS